LPCARQLVTLKDAASYIMKLPNAEQKLAEWQAATEALIMAAEGYGPSFHARLAKAEAEAGYIDPCLRLSVALPIDDWLRH
jgi:hypothetical protein